MANQSLLPKLSSMQSKPLQSKAPLKSISPLNNPAYGLPTVGSSRTSTPLMSQNQAPSSVMKLPPLMTPAPKLQSKAPVKNTAALSAPTLPQGITSPQLPSLPSVSQSPAAPQLPPAATPSVDQAASITAGVAQTNKMDELSKSLATLREQNLAYLKPTDKENSLQAQSDALAAQMAGVTASENLGLAKIDNQPIAMNFITGQQRALQQQAAAQTGALEAQNVPLQQQLAREQANRTLAFQIAQERIKGPESELTALQGKTAPIEVGGNLVTFNPATGKYEQAYSSPSNKTAEGFTLGPDETRFDAQGNLIATGPNKSLTQEQQLKNEQAQTAKSASTKMTVDASNIIDELKSHPGLSSAVGASSLLPTLPGTEKANVEAKIDQLKSLLALPQLQYLKGLGAMSDREFATIQASVGALNPKMTEQAFRSELNKIQSALRTTYQENKQTTSSGSNSQYSW